MKRLIFVCSKKIKKLGFIHDVNAIQDTINKINLVLNFNSVRLLGDKGYISKKNINIIIKSNIINI